MDNPTKHIENTDPLLTTQQCLKYLNLSHGYLYELIKKGKIPRPIKYGKSSRWRKSWMESFIAKAERGGVK